MFTHVAAAAFGSITAIDTHWIWQEGMERLTIQPFKIKDGMIPVPDDPGLGIKLDMEQVMRANAIYEKLGDGSRDDAAAMQFLCSGWSFDPKMPALMR